MKAAIYSRIFDAEHKEEVQLFFDELECQQKGKTGNYQPHRELGHTYLIDYQN